MVDGHPEEPHPRHLQLERRARQRRTDGDGQHGHEPEQGGTQHQSPWLGTSPVPPEGWSPAQAGRPVHPLAHRLEAAVDEPQPGAARLRWPATADRRGRDRWPRRLAFKPLGGRDLRWHEVGGFSSVEPLKSRQSVPSGGRGANPVRRSSTASKACPRPVPPALRATP